MMETEDIHKRTRILRFCARAFAESLRRSEETSRRDLDFAQKQVTMMSSWFVSRHCERMGERSWRPVPRENLMGWEVDSAAWA